MLGINRAVQTKQIKLLLEIITFFYDVEFTFSYVEFLVMFKELFSRVLSNSLIFKYSENFIKIKREIKKIYTFSRYTYRDHFSKNFINFSQNLRQLFSQRKKKVETLMKWNSIKK